LKAVWGGGLA